MQACEVGLWPATHFCCKLLRKCVHMGEVAERKVHKIMSIFINIARIKLESRNHVNNYFSFIQFVFFPYLKLSVVLINNGMHFLNFFPLH